VALDAAQRQEALELARHLAAADTVLSASVSRDQSRRTSMSTLRAAGRTDIGRVRAHNQDTFVASDHLAAVADGMGGHRGGEVAAELAAALVQAAFTGRSVDELRAAVRAANRAIWDRACETSDLEGMGTTICAAGLTEGGNLAVVHVGDSRAYVLHDGELRQLTDDHSVTADLVRRGELSEDEARHHPHRHVLTQALGAGPDVEPASLDHRLGDGDRLLLCTDGLFNEIDDNEIASTMAATGDIGVAADALVERALARGGSDNVSVVVAELWR
jgi:PPM family protein phosphatase